ncbi:MAG: UvrD-helicase domain-containing protein, partial [Chloroflexota bacterium]
MTSDLLTGLNPEQYKAVTTVDGPVLVLAGPGSGKTRVLTRRVAHLIQDVGIAPYHIMAVTFTNKAASEMRHRVSQFLGERVRGLQIGTFHSTCARILRMEAESTAYNKDYVIYDTDDQITAITQVLAELNIDKKKWTPRRILGAISSAKNEMILPDRYVGQDYFTEVVSRVYPEYQKKLRDNNAMDFDDLLVNMVLLLRNHDIVREKYQQRYPYVLVDEFQDTNTVQYQLVQLISRPQNNVFVVGDEDQSIYAFRGADYRNVLRFHQDYPDATVILLEQNYRSTQVVLDTARAVIDRNTNRTPKKLFTDREGGELVTVKEAYDDTYEAQYIMEEIDNLTRREGYDYTDIAIMYRTNAQSRALEAACRENR